MLPPPLAFRKRDAASPSSLREFADAAVHAWRMAVRYWTSPDWLFAWGALILLVILQFGTVYVMTWGLRWQQEFFDSLEQRRADLFAQLTLIFALIMLSQVILILVNSYFSQMLGLRWRAFMTDHYLGRWMARDQYYELERRQLIDNPDQRISEDIAIVTRNVPGLALNMIRELTTAVTFSVILLETARAVSFSIAGVPLVLPADLLVFAIAYALLGVVFIIFIGRPLVTRSRLQQEVEADFRAGLINVRRNAEQISIGGAHAIERRSLASAFAAVQTNFRRLILATLGLQTGSSVYTNLSSVLPLFVLVPRFFAGEITLGQIVAGRSAFTTVVGSLAFLVNSYSLIGMQIASIQRLRALELALDDDHPRGIDFSTGTTGSDGIIMRTDDLRLDRPDGRPLLQVAQWSVRVGERWVIRGASGAGKSTLLRAIAGLWPDGAGRVALSNDLRVMFVPQRLYLPLGSLKDAICFPDQGADHDDAAISGLLNRVGLGQHIDHLHERRLWQEELSPGEQQRVALARILLHRADVLVLDEATSALDFDHAQEFYAHVLEALPDVTLISVVHDERLMMYHSHCFAIADGRGAPSAMARVDP